MPEYIIVISVLLGVIFMFNYGWHLLISIRDMENNNYEYGWSTIIGFWKLYKTKSWSRQYGAVFISYDALLNNSINSVNTFIFNNIYMIFDPLSFILIKSFCWFKYLTLHIKSFYTRIINFKITVSQIKIFKTYKRVESETIMNKLTKE